MRRTLIRVLVVATWLVALPASGQAPAAGNAAGCDLDPRWLYVTVVGSEIVNTETGDRLDLSTSGPQLVDRCRIRFIGLTDPSLQPSTSPLPTIVTLDDGQYFLYVAESVVDICRALPDCVVPGDR